MDITVFGKATCPQCQKDFNGKLVLQLHEDSNGNMKMIPPLDEAQFDQDEVEINYEYGILKGSIEGTFICPTCKKTNAVLVDVPAEVME